MAPIGMGLGFGKASRSERSRKVSVDQIRAKQAEAAKSAPVKDGAKPAVAQPEAQKPMAHGKSKGGAPPVRGGSRDAAMAPDAHAAPRGFLSFVRDCCPNPVFEKWFGKSAQARAPHEAAGGIELRSLSPSPMPSREPSSRAEAETTPLLAQPLPESVMDAGPSGAADRVPKRSYSLPTPQGRVHFEEKAEARATVKADREGVARRRRGSNVSDLGTIPEAESVRARGPQPEGWTLDPVKPRREKQLTPAAERKLEAFRQHIRDGYKPSDAADLLGPGTWMKPLKASGGQFEIRLNQHDRVTFTIDEAAKRLTIQDVGGHT